MSKTLRLFCQQLTVWSVCALLCAVAQAQSITAPPAVGEITLVIGQSEVERETPQTLQAKKGDAILQGDVIKTSSSGHVHVRFVDGALVSVRPNSVFTIHEFKYDAANPAASVVRLSLGKGEVRSQWHHVIDVAPTILSRMGLECPSEMNGKCLVTLK